MISDFRDARVNFVEATFHSRAYVIMDIPNELAKIANALSILAIRDATGDLIRNFSPCRSSPSFARLNSTPAENPAADRAKVYRAAARLGARNVVAHVLHFRNNRSQNGSTARFAASKIDRLSRRMAIMTYIALSVALAPFRAGQLRTLESYPH